MESDYMTTRKNARDRPSSLVKRLESGVEKNLQSAGLSSKTEFNISEKNKGKGTKRKGTSPSGSTQIQTVLMKQSSGEVEGTIAKDLAILDGKGTKRKRTSPSGSTQIQTVLMKQSSGEVEETIPKDLAIIDGKGTKRKGTSPSGSTQIHTVLMKQSSGEVEGTIAKDLAILDGKGTKRKGTSPSGSTQIQTVLMKQSSGEVEGTIAKDLAILDSFCEDSALNESIEESASSDEELQNSVPKKFFFENIKSYGESMVYSTFYQWGLQKNRALRPIIIDGCNIARDVMLDLASRVGGVLVTNDKMQDMYKENENRWIFGKKIFEGQDLECCKTKYNEVKEILKNRMLRFSFAWDEFIITNDPEGRAGPGLLDIITF